MSGCPCRSTETGGALCPCDAFRHPSPPDIVAGLPTIPRQRAGFPEYRKSLIARSRMHEALGSWRPSDSVEGEQYGVMMLEWMAYVLDVLGFYDERISNEAYLRTALHRASVREAVDLIGYRPRPAVAATALLAAIADGERPVSLPPRTGVRSEAFDGEAPQIFETEIESRIDPLRNQWTVGPVRSQTWDNRILLTPDSAGPVPNQILVLEVRGGTADPQVGRVVRTADLEGRDGLVYREVTLEPAPIQFTPAPDLGDLALLSPTQEAGITTLSGSYGPVDPAAPSTVLPAIVAASGTTTFYLDGVYTRFRVGDTVVLGRPNDLVVAQVAGVEPGTFTVPTVSQVNPTTSAVTTNVALAPVTILEVDVELADWTGDAAAITVHYNMVEAGRPANLARVDLVRADFLGAGLALEGAPDPPPDPQPTQFFLQGDNEVGALAPGSVSIAPEGVGSVSVGEDAGEFTEPLRAPVTVFGNVVRVTRGESVIGEVLGSGDATSANQSFTLANRPLTYLHDPAAPDGRRNTLSVSVDGVQWSEVPSFFGRGEQAQVYIVRHDDDQNAIITFGDGVRGARLPSGVDNVVATYRYGAGAAKPPARAIRQLANPVPGLRRVLNPVAASGGADADSPDEIRENAPASALLLGRAVSIPDFDAVAREFGVLNARVVWAWNVASQGAVVKVWFIADDGDPAETAILLAASLRGMAEPSVPIVAAPATPIPTDLSLDVEVDERHNSETVSREVLDVLLDEESGLLALANVPIGGPIFRSRIFEAAGGVAGVVAVRGIAVDGVAPGLAIESADGEYHDFLETTQVNGFAPLVESRCALAV